MDIRQTNTGLSSGAGRGIAKTDGTGKLSNKIALTTGIGAATAMCFRAEGAKVIVTGSDPTTLQVAQQKMPGIDVIASEAGDVAATKAAAAERRDRSLIEIAFCCVVTWPGSRRDRRLIDGARL